MSEVYPFRAVFYNHEVVKDYSNVISPIEYRTPNIEFLHGLKVKNEFNIAHLTTPIRHESPTSNETTLLLSKPSEDKTPEEIINEYLTEQDTIKNRERVKKFYSWLEDESLLLDEYPGIYPHQREIWDESLQCIGHQQGVFALLQLENLAEGTIKLLYQPSDFMVEQALNQIKISFAHFSPIVFGFSDPKNSLHSVLKHHYADNPAIQAYDFEGYQQSLWAIHDEGAIDAVQKIFDNFNLVILEGAHYYLAAQKFRDEMKRLDHFGGDTENVENVLGYFVALDGQQKVELESVNKFITMDNAENLKIREPQRITKLRKFIEKNPDLTSQVLVFNPPSSHEKQSVQINGQKNKKQAGLPESAKVEDSNHHVGEKNADHHKKSIFRKHQNPLELDASELSETDKFWVSNDIADFNPLSEKYVMLAAAEYFNVEQFDLTDDFIQTYNTAKKLLANKDFRQVVIILPNEKKLLRLKIADFEKFKKLIPTRKSRIFNTFDIYVFWKYLLHKIYSGFSDKNQGVTYWDFKNFCDVYNSNFPSETHESPDLPILGSPSKRILGDIFTTPSYMLTREEQQLKFANPGLLMLFNPPKVNDLLLMAETDDIFTEQLFRLKYAPASGMLTYRYDFSEEDEA